MESIPRSAEPSPLSEVVGHFGFLDTFPRCLDIWLLSQVLQIYIPYISKTPHSSASRARQAIFSLHPMATATASASGSGLNGLTARDGETQNN